MRLGLLLPPLGGPAAGLSVYVREVASRLLELHPDWVVFDESGDDPPGWCDGHSVVALADRGPARLARRLHPRLGRVLAVQGDLRRALSSRGVGALLVPFHDGVLGCPVPQAIVVHDLTLLRHPPAGSLLARVYMRTLFRRVAAGADILVAVSEATAGDLRRRWGVAANRLRVVAEGYDRELFRAFDERDIAAARGRHGLRAPYLFYAGTFARHKNLDTLLTVLERLGDSSPRLVVAGPRGGADQARFLRAVRDRGLESRFESLGYVERRDLGPLMAGAEAFVFPSLAEGFGLAALEAMASGAVVLASDRASLPEVVGDGGLLLDPSDPAAWARALAKLTAEPERSRELRRRARRRAERFDWGETARTILDLLLEIGHSPRGAGAKS